MAADPPKPRSRRRADPGMSAPSGELRALTSVRGIAAWWVVLFHTRFAMDWLPAPALAVAARGYLAVDFFFLLSGFVIWLSSVDRLRAGGVRAIPAFLWRRVARIWPLHLFMLAGAVALALMLAATGRDAGGQFPFAELPWHILLVQNWGLADELTWNTPAWSISCELAAYLAFPMLALAIDWRRVPSPLLIAVIAALLVLLHLLYLSHGAWQLGHEITRIGVWRCLIEFACGTVIAALYLRWRARATVAAAGAGVLMLALLAGWAAGAAETLMVPAAFASGLLALALTSGMRGNPLNAGALHYLGEISYATYLGHFLLWFAFKLAFVRVATAVPAWQMACFAVMVLIASAAMYHGVERPAQRWLNALRWRPAARSHEAAA